MTHPSQKEQLETLISEQEALSNIEPQFPRMLFIDIFFAVPSFFIGMASIFDFKGVLLDQNRDTRSGFEKDVEALRSDWNVIGQDFFKVLDTFSDSEEPKGPWHE